MSGSRGVTSNPKAYVQEIKSITKELKRLNGHMGKLRSRRKVVQGHLYDYMMKNEIETLEGIKAKSIAPKTTKRPSLKAKKKAALELFSNVGIDDPEKFWDMLTKAQKLTIETNDEE